MRLEKILRELRLPTESERITKEGPIRRGRGRPKLNTVFESTIRFDPGMAEALKKYMDTDRCGLQESVRRAVYRLGVMNEASLQGLISFSRARGQTVDEFITSLFLGATPLNGAKED